MKTVKETATFKKQADKIWTEDERLAFVTYIAQHSNDGDVIPNAEGARKIRWSVKGSGKLGGVRVIYFNENQNEICLVAVYQKTDKANMSTNEIREVK